MDFAHRLENGGKVRFPASPLFPTPRPSPRRPLTPLHTLLDLLRERETQTRRLRVEAFEQAMIDRDYRLTGHKRGQRVSSTGRLASLSPSFLGYMLLFTSERAPV